MSRDVHEFWLPLGDVQVETAGRQRHVAAVENLITGERFPVDASNGEAAQRVNPDHARLPVQSAIEWIGKVGAAPAGGNRDAVNRAMSDRRESSLDHLDAPPR